MMRSVCKHSYIKAGGKGKGRARAHVSYLEHRPGEDRENKQPRQFFDKQRDSVSGKEIKHEIREDNTRSGVLIHKLMLSPGLQGVDLEKYTREVLAEWEKEKGLDLNWKAVAHKNTDHHHVHVVVAGKDLNGRAVRFDREDYDKIREISDHYLDREHYLERYLDRETSDLLNDRSKDRDINRLLFGAGDKTHSLDRSRDHDEFIVMDRELKRALLNMERSSGEIGHRMTREEWTRQQHGRHLDHHGRYTLAMEQQRIEDMMNQYPDLAESLKNELDYLKELDRETRFDNKPTDLDVLFGFGKGEDREPEKVDLGRDDQDMGTTESKESGDWPEQDHQLTDQVGDSDKSEESEKEREDDRGEGDVSEGIG